MHYRSVFDFLLLNTTNWGTLGNFRPQLGDSPIWAPQRHEFKKTNFIIKPDKFSFICKNK